MSKFYKNSRGGFSVESPEDPWPGSKLAITNSIFSSNSNFTFPVQNSTEVSLKNVSFTDNNCLAGLKNPPLILFSMHVGGVLNISGCKFHDDNCDLSVIRVSNVQQPMVRHHGEGCDARANSSTYFVEKNYTKITITNSEFFNNSGMSESTLLLQNGKATLVNNTFTNNFGFVSGSHLSVIEGSAMVDIIHTTFLQTLDKKTIWGKEAPFIRREVPFSGILSMKNSGQLHILNGSSFKTEFFGNVDPLIIVQGANKVAMDNTSSVYCSYGSKLHFNNFTHCELESTDPGKAPEFVRITTFTFACLACPVGTYSMKKGFSKGFQIHSNFTCQQCPFGGNCTYNLAAQPNFWGYPVSNGEIKFVSCPPGYCCSNKEYSCQYSNHSYDRSGCQGNRTGTLCGKCKDNFSETLFSTNCHRKIGCNDWLWSLMLALSCILLFALYLIHKPPILHLSYKHLFWFTTPPQQMGLGSTPPHKRQSLGFIKIIFYFYQIAGLLTVPSDGTVHILGDYIVLPIVGLFSFTFYDNKKFNVCPYPGLTQTVKTALPLLGVLTLHLSVLCIYIFHAVVNKLFKRSIVFPPIDAYLAASMECLLLSYSSLTYTLLKLLSWIEINGKLKWYYNASVPMDFSHWWQIACIVCILTLVVPFIFVLLVGSQRLYKGQISPGHFIVACYVPLPFLTYWLVQHCRAMGRKNSAQEMAATSSLGASEEYTSTCTEVRSMANGQSLVLEVVSAPFRKPEDQKSLGMIHWESVLIGRRFILIATALFIPETFLASVCLTVLCVLVLLHHMMRKPFHSHCANVIETLSLASLVIIATLNIALGAFYPIGIQVPKSYSWFITAFLYIEAVLLAAVPVAFALTVAVLCMSQMFRLILFLAALVHPKLHEHSTITGNDSTSEPLISEVTVGD